MHTELISKKVLLIIICYSLVFFGFFTFKYFFESRTKVVFCDVKEGDATYIRLKNKIDILIDAGATSLVTSCLGTHMPFFDKSIEYAFLTHVKKSQYEGYHHVLKRYSIRNFIVSTKYSPTTSYQKLTAALIEDGAQFLHPGAGEVIKISDGYFRVFWPQTLPTEQNRPLKKHAYTFEFVSSGISLLHIGFFPDVASLKRTGIDFSDYKFIKVSEYGFNTGLFAEFTALAEDAIFLINRPQNIAEHLRTEFLSHSKLRQINHRGDAVYHTL